MPASRCRIGSVIEIDGPKPLALPGDLADRVDESEYARLLGYSDRRVPSGLAGESAEKARLWFRRHASPWALVRRLPITDLGAREIALGSEDALSSRFLARRLRRAGADELIVALVSAGHEADERVAALWSDDRPDEAYFADRFAAAFAEHLAAWTGDRLRRSLRRRDRGLMASYGPGYTGWALDQMVPLGRCLMSGGHNVHCVPFPHRFEILGSGMIRPIASMLAVFGVTPDLDAADRSWRRSGCRWCALADCDFRR